MDRDSDFSAYVAARSQRLIRSAVLLGCSPTDAEDLAQTALMRCYASWEKVQDAQNVDAYVYRILFNTMMSGRRRKWISELPTAEPPDAAVADASDVQALGASVRAVLRTMTLDHRAVLVLRYFADLTDQQIAETLSLPLGTVKSRLARALAHLATDQRLSDLSGTENS